MREATKITKVYRFGELSDEAQEKALEKLRYLNVNFDWWDYVYEDAKNIGVKITEFDIDRGAYCRGEFLQDELTVAENILKEHGKTCETYQDAYEFVWTIAIAEDVFRCQDAEDFDTEEFDADYDCPDELEEFRRTIFEDYRIMLQKEYEYRTSREAIVESIEANEYEFTEDGKLY